MKYTFETVPCNLCESQDYIKVSEKGRFGLPTNVVICKKCGLGYLNPRWDSESYLKFYLEDYDTFYRPEIKSKQVSKEKKGNPIEIRLKQFNLLPNDVHKIL